MYITNFRGSDNKIKPTRLMWDWLLKRRVYTGDIHEQPKKAVCKDEDVVYISDKAKRMLRNAEIEETLSSGGTSDRFDRLV